MQKLTDLLNSIPKKLAEVIKNLKTKKPSAPVVAPVQTQEVYSSPTPVSTVPSAASAASSPPKVNMPAILRDKKTIKKIGIVIGVIVALLILISLLSRFMPKGLPNLLPTPVPSATPIVIVFTPPPSKYATDAGVLKIEADIQALDMELGAVELDETNLRPRPLDYNINFK